MYTQERKEHDEQSFRGKNPGAWEQEGEESFGQNGQQEEQKKVSEYKRSTLEVEIHRSPDHDKDPVER